MSLTDLIRKHKFGATATAATAATEELNKPAPVAPVATVAVAGTAQEQPAAFVAAASAADAATVSRWWLVHHADCPLVKVHCSPPMARVEVLAGRSNAVGADPFKPAQWTSLVPTAAGGESAAWVSLADSDDTDAASAVDDERRTCVQCRNLLPDGRCAAAARGELNATRTFEPVPDQLWRCAGFLPGPDDPDQRTGRERHWPA